MADEDNSELVRILAANGSPHQPNALSGPSLADLLQERASSWRNRLGGEAQRRPPAELRATPPTWRDRASGAAGNAIGGLMNKIAPGMFVEQNRPTLEEIMALDGGRYVPGQRESGNAVVDLSRTLPPMSPREVEAMMQYLYGTGIDQEMLPGPH